MRVSLKIVSFLRTRLRREGTLAYDFYIAAEFRKEAIFFQSGFITGIYLGGLCKCIV